MPHKHTPVKDSSFGPFPPDLAHFMLVHIHSLSYLLLLKCVSHSVANAVRRAIHSKRLMDSDDVYNEMQYALRQCTLSFPVQVGYEFDCENALSSTTKAPSNVLIVHEFHLEFRHKHIVVTNLKHAIEWFTKAWEYNHDNDTAEDVFEKHMSQMVVTCTQFCIEWPGIGIFHSVEALWDQLGVKTEQDVIIKENSFRGDLWAISDRHAHLALELAIRLNPVAFIGESSFTFETNMDSNPDICYFQQSLLHNFLTDRLHKKRL